MGMNTRKRTPTAGEHGATVERVGGSEIWPVPTRGTAVKIREQDVQRAALDYLNIRGYCLFRNNTGMTRASYKGKERFIRFGSIGWPDIIGLTKEGQFFGIEFKSEKGKLTEAQIAVGEKIRASKGIYIVARSLDDVISAGF